MLRHLDPKLIVNNRLGKQRVFLQGGMSPPESTVGDFGTPEQETGRFYGDRNIYWESNMTICQQWAWKPNDQMKSLKECIDLLVTNAGYDGNFMLNVGPMPDGRIEPRQVERLREIGRWMKQYGTSIYGTRGGPFKPAAWGVATCKDNKVYVHVLRWNAAQRSFCPPWHKGDSPRAPDRRNGRRARDRPGDLRDCSREEPAGTWIRSSNWNWTDRQWISSETSAPGEFVGPFVDAIRRPVRRRIPGGAFRAGFAGAGRWNCASGSRGSRRGRAWRQSLSSSALHSSRE